MTKPMGKFLPLTRPHDAADCFRMKGETINQDNFRKKTTEAMALSMYGVELLENIKHHLFACKIEKQQRHTFGTFKKSLCHSFWRNPIPFLGKIMPHHIGQY